MHEPTILLSQCWVWVSSEELEDCKGRQRLQTFWNLNSQAKAGKVNQEFLNQESHLMVSLSCSHLLVSIRKRENEDAQDIHSPKG